MARRLFVDIDNARLVSGFESGVTPLLDNLFEADVADYELYFLREGEAGSRRYEIADFSGASIKLHIGEPPPSTATAFVAAEAWTNLATAVTASVARTITGGSGVSEQQLLSFDPATVEGTFALTFPSQPLTFTALSSGVFTTSGAHGLATLQPFVPTGFTTPSGFTNGQTLFVTGIIAPNQFLAADTVTATAVTGFSAATAGSGFTVTASTFSLPATASPAQVEAALAALPSIGGGNVNVTGQAGRSYTASFSGEKGQVALPLLTVAAALGAPLGKTATVNFNTVELANAISASATLEAVMEIEATEGGKTQTLLQVPVTLRNDLITSSSPTPLPAGTSFLLASPDESTWQITIDNDGILTAEKQ